MGSQKFDAKKCVKEIQEAAQWQAEWDPDVVRQAVSNYEHHMRILHQTLSQLEREKTPQVESELSSSPKVVVTLEDVIADWQDTKLIEQDVTVQQLEDLVSPETVESAFRSALRMNLDTSRLSVKVRELERLVGLVGKTPLTDPLSFSLLKANGKAGNIGRALALLNMRKARNYPPRKDQEYPSQNEFVHAIQSIESAGLYLRKNRNVFAGDVHQPAIDNPTRWLDAILVNMFERNVQLTPWLANRMLETYASTGRTGKALHFFYDMKRDHKGIHHDPETGQYSYIEDNDTERPIRPEIMEQMPIYKKKRIKVRVQYNPPPPYHKVPSLVKDTGVMRPDDTAGKRISKLDRESDKDWSLPLTAALVFADSLTQGACGHDPISLNLQSYNVLIKACCYRGALWRALHILNKVLPRQNLEPNTTTYNIILSGMARVGDVDMMKEFLITMTNKGVPLNMFTVQAMVEGMLNVGDIGGAVTMVQDLFNQHGVIPPPATHFKILEIALANCLVYEAKRHVYFLQQLWKWAPQNSRQERQKEKMMKNPQLSRPSLKTLFGYFGEALTEEDFF
uniref:Pentacotripeptide-repeat region of PRORP domain-containing protein n=1 Tax=Attheya septentrionalis TaxID=420275 RepID=A0A7S2U743_9STRA